MHCALKSVCVIVRGMAQRKHKSICQETKTVNVPECALLHVDVYAHVQYEYIDYTVGMLMCVLAECSSLFEVSQSG